MRKWILHAILLLFGALILNCSTQAQTDPKLYLGFGVGFYSMIYRFEPPKPIPEGGKTSYSRSIHLSVMYSLQNNWVIESGFSMIELPAPGFIADASGVQDGPGMMLVPFRLNYKWTIVPGEIEIMAFGGYTQGFRFEQVTFGFDKEDNIEAYGDYYGKVMFPLADIGARIKFPLGRIHLGMSANYTKGFKDIYNIQVLSMPNVVGGFPTSVTSKGSHFNIRLDAY